MRENRELLVVRIDHFRGFDEYFSIPYGSETAAEGHWEKGPGIELFRAVEQALAAEKDPADQETPKRDLPADHPLRAEELGVTAEESCSLYVFFSRQRIPAAGKYRERTECPESKVPALLWKDRRRAGIFMRRNRHSRGRVHSFADTVSTRVRIVSKAGA